jgi:PIN domain nuclease of toxin-antitoxin system
MLLLDTCTLLWLVDSSERLSSRVQDAVRKPEAQVYVSPVSALELGLKIAKRKIGLPLPVSKWYPEVCGRFQLIELPITGRIAAAAAELPALHADPADRLLIATASEHNLLLATPDPSIAAYPQVKVIW